MVFTKKIKDSFGGWVDKIIPVLDIVSQPLNVRGKISGCNWSVKYTTTSIFGDGKQVNTEYFPYKKDAVEFINRVQTSN